MSFNLCMLKILSFMIDYHWFKSEKPSESQQEHSVKCRECKKNIPCLKYRMQEHSDNYSLIAFVSYASYFPLYLAGPTTTYNAWISQVKLPQSLISTEYIIFYFFRLVTIWVLLEVLIHFSYYGAIVNIDANEHIWKKFSPTEFIFASYCLLNFLWLKFAFI